ncbi:MAG TPA: hypothetical protein VFL64_17980 [Rhizobacter sp.]|nr:hypothetical protein [Rhizobacter sp.]
MSKDKPLGRTKPVVDSESAPRLPHEHDESSDSQVSDERPIIRQAHDDLASGKVDTDRGVPMHEAYQRQKKPAKKSRPT